jgi:hypothetical protein
MGHWRRTAVKDERSFQMAEEPDRIAEIKAEFEKLLSNLQTVRPPQRMSAEIDVLGKIRELARWAADLAKNQRRD